MNDSPSQGGEIPTFPKEGGVLNQERVIPSRHLALLVDDFVNEWRSSATRGLGHFDSVEALVGERFLKVLKD
jgi:hypothetical protein